MVLYFTGTGNSRYIAEKIAAIIEEPVYSINDAIKTGTEGPVYTGEKVILVTPTYSWRIPRVVKDWLLRTQLTGAQKIWFVMDCGSEIGNAAKYNRPLADKKKLRYMGTAEIVMPENYIAMFSAPSEKEAEEIIKRAQPFIEKDAEYIKNNRDFPVPKNSLMYRFLSGPVNISFYPLCVKADAYTAGDKCISCGKCVTMCPLNNIELKDGRPVWGKNCTQCMACINYCPTEAIEYGKHSVGLRRYHI